MTDSVMSGSVGAGAFLPLNPYMAPQVPFVVKTNVYVSEEEHGSVWTTDDEWQNPTSPKFTIKSVLWMIYHAQGLGHDLEASVRELRSNWLLPKSRSWSARSILVSADSSTPILTTGLLQRAFTIPSTSSRRRMCGKVTVFPSRRTSTSRTLCAWLKAVAVASRSARRLPCA